MSHRTTIIFSDSLWRDLQSMRGDENASDYVRVAVLARIYYERGLNSNADMANALKKAKKNA